MLLADIEHVTEYREIMELVLRAGDRLGSENFYRPEIILEWALFHDIDVPRELLNFVEKYKGNLQPWDPALGQFASRKVVISMGDGTTTPDSSNAVENEKVLTTRERETLLMIIAAMSIQQYSWTPNKKNTAVTEIIRDFEAIKLGPISDDTVRAKLKEASDLVPQSVFQDAD